MENKPGTGLKLRGCSLAIAAALAVSSPAYAVQFQWGDWDGQWDNTITYGISWRGESPDPALIGAANGGTGPAILTDDGNLNFDSGDIFSNIVKGTSEIQIDNGQFGAFGRIKYWYDFKLENGSMPHGHSPNNYVPGAKLNDDDFANFAQFSGLALLDLFAYGNFELGDYPLDVRLGNQVVNWGEATFIQGVNILNPIDVSAFRRPGAEIKEGLLPLPLLYANLGMGGGWSVEAFYQFKWKRTVIDGCGTYFSTVDFAAKGCNDLVVGNVLPDIIAQNVLVAKKDPNTVKARNGGQWGLAIRNYVDKIDTEFGFYYERLHSRLPVINVRYNLQAALDGSTLINPVTGIPGPVPVYYQIAYPEDIDIWGLSFATNIGVVAVSGEVSYKKDMPVGVHGTTELIAGLGALGGLAPVGGSVAACLVPAPAALGQFGSRAWAALCDFATTGDGLAQGWDRFDVTQAQTTALYFWDQGLGAQRITLIGEVAWIHTGSLPSIAEMPYGRNPIFGAPVNLGGVNDKGFVTSNSWGYRIRAVGDYPNVFAGVGLTPGIAWSQDVNGTSPTPTFSDGRKALGISLGANYLTKYRAKIAYTWFMGGVANAAVDRDFFSITFSADF